MRSQDQDKAGKLLEEIRRKWAQGDQTMAAVISYLETVAVERSREAVMNDDAATRDKARTIAFGATYFTEQFKQRSMQDIQRPVQVKFPTEV